MADRSSAASAAWTSGLSERESASPSSASKTPTADGFSPDTGRESPALRTCETWQAFDDDENRTLRVDSPWDLIFSSEDSPAKTSPSPVPDEDSSTASDPASSSSSPESLTLFSPMEAGLNSAPGGGYRGTTHVFDPVAEEREACAFDPKPDGPRFAACGDAVTVNVSYWIGCRLMANVHHHQQKAAAPRCLTQ